MKVVLAKSAGFCMGVRNAVNKARELSSSDGKVYTDGPLIHNREMMDRLAEDGIVVTEKPESIDNSTLLIRAHGIPPERRKKLQELDARIVDATCPDVARIQGLIRKHARQGYSIVIYGDKGHAEVTGLLGFAEGNGHVISSIEDIQTLPHMEKVCLVSQSTQFPFAYDEIANELSKRFADTLVLDTICKSTKDRQAELVAIAGEAEVIVVVGGSHSANTVRLVELARTLKPTIHIQTADQLNVDDFKECSTVGLTAGASTPQFIIEDVKKRLEEI